MEYPDFLKRLFVKITGFRPEVFDAEKKEEMRRKLTEANRKQDRDLAHSGYTEGLDYEETGLPECSGWLIRRSGNPEDKIIYYIHGGGFTGACTKDRMKFVSALVKEFGYNVFSVDYRLAPEHMQPCQVLDCLDGYRWCMERWKPENTVFLGESAGANLAVALCVLLRDRGLPQPAGVFANSGAYQFDRYTESYERCSLKTDFIVVKSILENMKDVYCRDGEEKDPYVAPLYADLSGLAPVWLTVSRSESLYYDSLMLYGKLKEYGNDAVLREYDGLCHAFIISPDMRGVRKKSYGDLKDFLDGYLG